MWSACTVREPFTFLQSCGALAPMTGGWSSLGCDSAVHASPCLNSRIVKTGCKAVHLPPIFALFDENLHTLHTTASQHLRPSARSDGYYFGNLRSTPRGDPMLFFLP